MKLKRFFTLFIVFALFSALVSAHSEWAEIRLAPSENIYNFEYYEGVEFLLGGNKFSLYSTDTDSETIVECKDNKQARGMARHFLSIYFYYLHQYDIEVGNTDHVDKNNNPVYELYTYKSHSRNRILNREPFSNYLLCLWCYDENMNTVDLEDKQMMLGYVFSEKGTLINIIPINNNTYSVPYETIINYLTCIEQVKDRHDNEYKYGVTKVPGKYYNKDNTLNYNKLYKDMPVGYVNLINMFCNYK